MVKQFLHRYYHQFFTGTVFILFIGFSTIPAIYAQELQWKVFGHLREARTVFRTAAVGQGKVLVMGGLGEQMGNHDHGFKGHVLSSCEMIDINSRQISPAPSMNSPHANGCMLQTRDSNVVIVSGLNTDSTTTPICEIYDRQQNRWRILGALLIGRHQHSAAFLNDEEIIVVGGRAKFNFAGTIAEAEVFNLRTGLSRFVDDFPDKICGGMSLDSRIFFPQCPMFFGGRSEGSTSYHVSNMYYFDKLTSHWIRLGTYPEAMGGMAVQRLLDGRLVLAGGVKKGSSASGHTALHGSRIYLENQHGFSVVGMMSKASLESRIEAWNTDILLIIGGMDERRVIHGYSEWFDFQTHQSVNGPLLNTPRCAHTSVSFPTFDSQGRQQGSCILVIGGFNAQSRSLSSVEILETTNPQLLEVPNPEIASQRLKKLLTSPTVIATLAGFILILIAGLLYLLYQVLIIRRQSKFSMTDSSVKGQK